METKHTPGNWHTTGLEVRDYKGMIVAQVYDHNQNNVNREECLANAKLIASAPELLESLKTILSNFKSCISHGNGELDSDKEEIEKAERAIKKATE